jgi:flagellar assembly protein FliH
MATTEIYPAIKRFRFASFDGKEEAEAVPAASSQPAAKTEPAPAAPAGPLPLPLALPAITEKDLQSARAEAQSQGYREGYAAAQAKFTRETNAREEAVKSLLEIIANRITIAAETHREAIKEREVLMAKLVMASAKKVAGDALKKEPYATVESLLHECMALIAGEAKVKVVVSHALAAGLRQRIDMLKPALQDFEGELVVEEDNALLEQDCRVEWTNGHAERTNEDVWRAIEAVIMKTNVNN